MEWDIGRLVAIAMYKKMCNLHYSYGSRESVDRSGLTTMLMWGETLTISFWDDAAKKIPPLKNTKEQVIVVVAATSALEQHGMLILKSTRGTRNYVEHDIPEVAKLKKRSSIQKKKSIMPTFETKTILHPKQLIKQQIKPLKVINFDTNFMQNMAPTFAEVIKVYQNRNWSCSSYRVCRRNPSLRKGRSWCKHCKAYVKNPVFRYIIQIPTKDASGDATVFEEAGTTLVGFNSKELSAMREDVSHTFFPFRTLMRLFHIQCRRPIKTSERINGMAR